MSKEAEEEYRSLIKVANINDKTKSKDNAKNNNPMFVYIGRKTKYIQYGSPLGNPFKANNNAERNDVVEGKKNAQKNIRSG